MFPTVEHSPKLYSRLAGVFYLAIILLGMFGELFARGALVVSGDATTTANNILTSQSLWRAGLVGDLLMHVFDLPVTLAFYLLLRPVSRSLSMLVVFFHMIQTAVLVANKLNLLLPLLLLEDSRSLTAFSPEQLHSLSYLAIRAHGYGFAIGLLFFGFGCLIQGYLLWKSEYFPKLLGLLIFLAGMSYLINSFALLLAPDFAASLFPAVLVPAFVGELSLCLWMIVKGVDLPQWEKTLAA